MQLVLRAHSSLWVTFAFLAVRRKSLAAGTKERGDVAGVPAPTTPRTRRRNCELGQGRAHLSTGGVIVPSQFAHCVKGLRCVKFAAAPAIESWAKAITAGWRSNAPAVRP